jgi:hypothetical protein
MTKIGRVAEGTKSDFIYSMESHFYRTLLETALVQYYYPKGGKQKMINIRGLPRKKALTFADYSRLAVQRMAKQISTNTNSNNSQTVNTGNTNNKANDHPNTNTKDNEDMTDFLESLEKLYEEYRGFNPHVNVTLLLRSVISPVLESFILMDRFLYLQECGAVPFLVPLFDESLSPRNMAIVAYKP